MGCFFSRMESREMVSSSKARLRWTKQFGKARIAFSASHIVYLRNTGAALLQFATAESPLQHHHSQPVLPSSSPTPPWRTHPLPPINPAWATSTSSAPPPDDPPSSFIWEYMNQHLINPFMNADSGISPISAPTRDIPVVVSTKSKDLVEIIKKLDQCFLRAADSGGKLSDLLEVPCTFSDQTSSGKNHGSWNSSHRFPGSHSSTLERLYEWERELYKQVKNVDRLNIKHEKRTKQLRKLELKTGDRMKTEKTKKEVQKLEAGIMVSNQAIKTTSQEIFKLRDLELYPQLVEIVKGLMFMWESLYKSHGLQMRVVEQQLKYFNSTSTSTDTTTEIHHQLTLKLEVEVKQWHTSFCNMVKSQQDYIQSLTNWLLLSLFTFSKNSSSQTKQNLEIYSLCEGWKEVVDNTPDKVASQGIKALLSVVHAIVVQQRDEHKQKRRSDSFFMELEKKTMELQAAESKYGPGVYSGPLSKKLERVAFKRAKVEVLRAKAEEQKAKYEKAIGVTRSLTLDNLQTGLPDVFQAVMDFANVWTHVFKSVCKDAKIPEEVNDDDVNRTMN